MSFMLDVRRLKVLHAVSEYGSVTAAAAALGYSAPAVSQQLAALEREAGIRLTERAGRGIGLTPAADILVAHASALLARLDAAVTEPYSLTACSTLRRRTSSMKLILSVMRKFVTGP